MDITKEDIIKLLPNIKIIGEKLAGGQKIVFQTIINNKKNALKIIVHDNNLNGEEDTRCFREVETLQLCDSSNLIKLGEIPLTYVEYNSHGIHYYTEEWIEGCNLLEYIKDNGGTLDENEVIKLGIDISYAIEELWKFNKIHRDIKPNNIMYDQYNNRFVLLDLGVVYDAQYDTLTKFGFLPGTMGYYSPEQFDLTKKKDLDFRSDLFCLGIVMYEALTGNHPFRRSGQTNEQIFYNIIHEQHKAIRELNEDVSDELEGIVQRLLRKRPSERYRSVRSFRDRLSEMYKEGM